MENEIRNAISGLGSPQLTPEPTAQLPEVQLPPVTIYDFGRLLAEYEPPPRKAKP